MEGSDKANVSLSELTFPDGVVYLASAVPPSLEKVTEIARSQDSRPTPSEPYTRLDKLMLLGCHLEATNQSGSSGKINLLMGDIAPEFEQFSLRALHESKKPNARRIYYAYTNAKKIGAVPQSGVDLDPDVPVLVRLAATDKANQLKVLKRLTSHSNGQLRKFGAGSK